MNDVMRKQYRKLTGKEEAQIECIKQMANELHDFLGGVGTSRELSLAKTKLEEAVMWAVKHITL